MAQASAEAAEGEAGPAVTWARLDSYRIAWDDSPAANRPRGSERPTFRPHSRCPAASLSSKLATQPMAFLLLIFGTGMDQPPLRVPLLLGEGRNEGNRRPSAWPLRTYLLSARRARQLLATGFSPWERAGTWRRDEARARPRPGWAWGGFTTPRPPSDSLAALRPSLTVAPSYHGLKPVAIRTCRPPQAGLRQRHSTDTSRLKREQETCIPFPKINKIVKSS